MVYIEGSGEAVPFMRFCHRNWATFDKRNKIIIMFLRPQVLHSSTPFSNHLQNQSKVVVNEGWPLKRGLSTSIQFFWTQQVYNIVFTSTGTSFPMATKICIFCTITFKLSCHCHVIPFPLSTLTCVLRWKQASCTFASWSLQSRADNRFGAIAHMESTTMTNHTVCQLQCLL